MKRILCIFFLGILLMNTKADAQKLTDLGVKAGISIPNLTSGKDANPISSGYSSRLDIDAAIHAEFVLTRHFSIQPQLEYSSQGGKKNGGQAFTTPSAMQQLFPAGEAPQYLYANYKSNTRINYLMLPLLVKYRIDIANHWQAYIQAGPFISLLLAAHNNTSGSSIIYLDPEQTQPLSPVPQPFDNNENVKSDLHLINSGVCGYAGCKYKLPNGSIFIEAGGNYGLIDIQKNTANGKNKTGAASIVAGYQFHISIH